MEHIERKCKNCGVVKPIEKFVKNTIKYYRYTCKECDNIINRDKRLAYNKKYREVNPDKKREWSKMSNLVRKQKIQSDPDYHDRVKFLKRESGRKNKVSTMWHNAKKRALKNNLEFTIKPSDIVIPEKCPILNVVLVAGRGKDYLFTPTLDRVDITKGYTIENTKVISMLANSMKNSATREQLEIFCKNILKYMDE
jgi:hypothetical protein